MRKRSLILVIVTALLIAKPLLAGSPTTEPGSAQPMLSETRLLIVRSLDAEFVVVRREIPAAAKTIVIQNGQISVASEDEPREPASSQKAKAKPGDRAQITNIEFQRDRIVFDMNGGWKKKTKWYQGIQVSGLGGVTREPDSDKANRPRGWSIELAFDKFVPEMTSAHIRQLLNPVIDFKARSAAQVYLDTVPPKVKAALEKHQVLVGMNHEMVMYAKGIPDKRIRERDQQGRAYEEWLYGTPPQEVQFVRFIGDKVVRLEIMTMDGNDIVRTEKEVDLKPAPAANRLSNTSDASVTMPAPAPN